MIKWSRYICLSFISGRLNNNRRSDAHIETFFWHHYASASCFQNPLSHSVRSCLVCGRNVNVNLVNQLSPVDMPATTRYITSSCHWHVRMLPCNDDLLAFGVTVPIRQLWHRGVRGTPHVQSLSFGRRRQILASLLRHWFRHPSPCLNFTFTVCPFAC